MRAELERVEAEYAKMQAQLEQSSGGVSATALGEQSATGTEIPEEDALLEILNGVGDLRAESLRGTKTDEAEIHPEMPRMDRYSAVGEVDTEEIRAAPSPTREMTSNGNGKRKPLPMRLSQEVPLEELLQVQSEREDRQRRQVEQQPADAEREQEHSTSGQLSEEQEAEKDLSSLQLEDTNDIVKLEQLKARLAALDDARVHSIRQHTSQRENEWWLRQWLLIISQQSPRSTILASSTMKGYRITMPTRRTMRSSAGIISTSSTSSKNQNSGTNSSVSQTQAQSRHQKTRLGSTSGLWSR
jgi:hypothetical protein